MQLSRVLIVVSFLFASASAATADDGSIPGRRLIVGIPTAPLKPLLNSHDIKRIEERSESVLRGLLQIRQSSCPRGYSKCSSLGCCEIGGDCCANKKCCDSGSHCCDGGGCCDNDHACYVDATTGDRGCCPIGEMCGGKASICEHQSDAPCPNDDFCCPLGNICYRDSDGDPRCRTGSIPPPTTRLTTASRTTSTKSLFTTDDPVFTTEDPVFSTRTGTAFVHGPTVYPSPAPFSDFQIVDSTDTRIAWYGSWTDGPSSCNSSAKSRKTSSTGQSLLFVPASVRLVYLSLTGRNVVYTVQFRGSSTTYTVNTTLNDCKLVWSSGPINSVDGISITVDGPATPPPDRRRQLDDDWYFEFHSFVVTTHDPTATGLINPSSLTVPTNAVVIRKTQPMLYTGLAMAFVLLFAFV